jgi:hypothetical protein
VRPGRDGDHSPPSSAVVLEEQSYTSAHPLGHTGPVTGLLYLFYNTLGIAVFTLDAGLLARSQYPEGSTTGHLDTGFSWFPWV